MVILTILLLQVWLHVLVTSVSRLDGNIIYITMRSGGELCRVSVVDVIQRCNNTLLQRFFNGDCSLRAATIADDDVD